MNEKRHIFLTGPVQIGKSTAIRRALAALKPARLGGFRSVSVADLPDGALSVYLIPAAAEMPSMTEQNRVGIRKGFRRGIERFPEAFETAGILCFERPILTFFGADEALLAMAREYMRPIKCVFPLFLFNQMLAAFLRNDQDPGRAALGVLSGGVFNIFGNYFFVFVCDMGIYGAGLATAIGSGISFLVLLSHFVSRKNTLRLAKPERLFGKLRKISVTGFSTFFIDVAMGILTVLFNRQIMKYLGANALAIYGPIIQVSTFVQCCAYSVGQASQPIISTNFGAGKGARIKGTLRLALWTTVFFGVFWTALSMACPNLYIRIFLSPTQEILDMAPAIIRTYALSFLLPFNIFSTYYFQAIMKPAAAFVVSVARGLVISGLLILSLPVLTGADSMWLAMPVTELLVMLYAAATIRRYTQGRFRTKRAHSEAKQVRSALLPCFYASAPKRQGHLHDGPRGVLMQRRTLEVNAAERARGQRQRSARK